jgi:AcrR family transcriptional regulator
MSSESSTPTQRPYRKRLRAEREEETRERITKAAVNLHGTIGPARTTITGVAEEAGVQRATVYRHFPTEEDLFDACSSHYGAEHPAPDAEAWREIGDPGLRLRRGLADYYDYYAETEPMFENVVRDAPVVPAMAKPVMAGAARLARAVDVLMTGRPERGAARGRVRAAVAHALSFPTWQSLVRQQGLDPTETAAVMTAMVEGAGAARPRAAPRP